MSAEKLALFRATDAPFMDWKYRHTQAMRHPRTLFEKAFRLLLDGWECYALAHKDAYGSEVLEDGVLGPCYADIGEGFLGLLNGELGRLDGGTLDHTIRSRLEPPKADKDASELDATPGEEKNETDVENGLSLCRADAPAPKELSPLAASALSTLADDAISDASPLWPPGVTEPLQMSEEKELVAMLRSWKRYGEKLRQAAGTGFYLNSTFSSLRHGWRQIGEGFRLILHPGLFDLDAQTLEAAIMDVLAHPMEQEEEQPSDNFFDNWEPSSEPDYEVSCYSRAQAIEDGVLIDVTKTAKEAGFRIPVAITQALWADITAIPEKLKGAADSVGRLWDILFLGVQAMKKNKQDSLCLYPLEMPVGESKRYKVKAHCGPGDKGEPVITLMKPEED